MPRLARAPAPKSQTPTLVAPLLGDLGFPATPEDQWKHSPTAVPLRLAQYKTEYARLMVGRLCGSKPWRWVRLVAVAIVWAAFDLLAVLA